MKISKHLKEQFAYVCMSIQKRDGIIMSIGKVLGLFKKGKTSIQMRDVMWALKHDIY